MGWRKGYRKTELLQSFDKTMLDLLFIANIKVISAQVAILGTVTDHMIGNHEN